MAPGSQVSESTDFLEVHYLLCLNRVENNKKHSVVLILFVREILNCSVEGKLIVSLIFENQVHKDVTGFDTISLMSPIPLQGPTGLLIKGRGIDKPNSV